MTKPELEKNVKNLIETYGNNIWCVYKEAVKYYQLIQKFKTFDKELKKELVNILGEFEWETTTDKLGWTDSDKGVETDYATFYECYKISEIEVINALYCLRDCEFDKQEFFDTLMEHAEIFYTDDYNIFNNFTAEAVYQKSKVLYNRLKNIKIVSYFAE